MKGIIYGESPQRPIKEPPKKSLSKHFNFQAVKVGGVLETESQISTPKNEGGIRDTEVRSSSALSNINADVKDFISPPSLNNE